MIRKVNPRPVYQPDLPTIGVKNVSNFGPFRFVELPFPSETPFINPWNSFRTVPFRIVAVHTFARRPHCEDISSSNYVGTAFSSFHVCATKKPCFAPPLASLYRVCGGRGTRNSQLERNETGNVLIFDSYCSSKRTDRSDRS